MSEKPTAQEVQEKLRKAQTTEQRPVDPVDAQRDAELADLQARLRAGEQREAELTAENARLASQADDKAADRLAKLEGPTALGSEMGDFERSQESASDRVPKYRFGVQVFTNGDMNGKREVIVANDEGEAIRLFVLKHKLDAAKCRWKSECLEQAKRTADGQRAHNARLARAGYIKSPLASV